MKLKFFEYRNRMKTGPGSIDEDIKLARKKRMRMFLHY
jgi:hypothetical protein